MAAHILSALRQIRDGQTKDMVFHLGHTGWADQLDFEDWRMFMHIAAKKDERLISNFANYLMDRYYRRWVGVGEPNTLEQWYENLSKLRQEGSDA